MYVYSSQLPEFRLHQEHLVVLFHQLNPVDWGRWGRKGREGWEKGGGREGRGREGRGREGGKREDRGRKEGEGERKRV